jgi:hypothetical protein
MRLRIQDFVDPSINPNGNFQPLGPNDELLSNALLDPALHIDNLSLPTNALQRVLAESGLVNLLSQQQYLVYDVARSVGIRSSYVAQAKVALQFFEVLIHHGSAEEIAAQAIQTAIGIASTALSAIPTIYTQIAAMLVSAMGTVLNFAFDPQGRPRDTFFPLQSYSTETDNSQFNENVRGVLKAGYDWSTLFMPRFKGKLTMQLRHSDATGRYAFAWALGDGQIPVPIVSGSGSNKTWHVDDGTFPASGNFGLGFVPGGQRIYSVVQSTVTEDPVGPTNDHPSLFDPRCAKAGSSGVVPKTETIDVGSYYPITTQGVLSLWDFCMQRNASMYTLNTQAIANAWEDYFDSIWDGVVSLWGNFGPVGGWGCGVWESALADLVRNYTVGVGGQIGLLSWAPSPSVSRPPHDDEEAVYLSHLSAIADTKWKAHNVFKVIIMPALMKLREAQLYYLRHTTMAAYLPITGGKNANPLAQESVMGSMYDVSVREAFTEGRLRILNGASKHDVRLHDVLDDEYAAQISQAGGGTDAPEPFGFTAGPQAPQIAVPRGGTGLPSGPMFPPSSNFVAPPRRSIAKPVLIGGALAAAYWQREAIMRFLRGLRR